MSYSQLSRDEIADEQIIIEAAKIDPNKFEILYNRYFSTIFGFIFNRTSDKQLSSDISSQVFLKAMINIKNYKSKGVSFSAWLYRIASNEISTFYRQTQRVRTISIDTAGVETFAENIETNLGDDRHLAILKILEDLPEKSVKLIEMRFFENRPYSEIANILGISENNAKVKVHRILQKIKKKAGNTILKTLAFFMQIATLHGVFFNFMKN